MSPQVQDIFTQIDSLNQEEKVEVFRYLEQQVQEDEKVEKSKSVAPSAHNHKKSAYDLLAEIGVIGAAKNLPPDLSSNQEYLNEFGRS